MRWWILGRDGVRTQGSMVSGQQNVEKWKRGRKSKYLIPCSSYENLPLLIQGFAIEKIGSVFRNAGDRGIPGDKIHRGWVLMEIII